LIQSLVDTVGPFLDVENITFLRLDDEEEYLICEIQWRKDGTDTGLGEKVPFHVFKRVFGKPFYSFSVEDIPAFAKPILSPIMKKYGTKSSLIVPFGDINNPRGYLNVNTYSYSKKFTDDEIQILIDAVKVISLKSSQLEAIDKLQQNEKILKGLSENQKMLLDNIQTQVWFLSDDHTYGQVNKAHAEFNGLKKEELAFKDMYDVFPKDVVDVCKEGNRKVFTEKKPLETEERVLQVSGQQRLIKIFKNPKFDENGNVEYVVCSAEDITDQKKAEDNLKIRLNFEHLISEISSTFVNINPDDKDDVIDNALSLIGNFTGIDRAYMFMFENDGQIMNNTHEWCAEGIIPEIDNLKNVSINEGMPWFADKIRKGDVFQLTNLDDLPAEANLEYQHFKSQGIKSLIIVPLVSDGDVKGFIGFDSVRNQRGWSDDDQRILKLIGEIISGALKRIKSEELLQKSERKYRSIIDNMQDVYYRSDLQGNLELISPSALKLFGYGSMDAIIGMNISKDFYAEPEQRDVFLNTLKKNGGSITNYEVTLKKKDGSLLTVITSSAFHYDDHGDIAGVEGIFSDITERKKIEDALVSSENNFRTFFETVDDLIFIGNQLGEIIYTNSAVSRKLGYTKEELKTKHVLDVHPSEKRSEVEQIFADMSAGKRSICTLPLQAKDGMYLPVETRVWFGKWDGLDCIFRVSKDLTEQHAALEKFHKLFDNNPALMALSSLPGREFVEVNESFIKRLGYSREEIVGKTAQELDLFIEEDKQIEVSHQLEKNGFIKDIELKVRCKDGHIIESMFSGEIIDTQKEKSFLTVMTDITDRKRAEEEAKRQMDKISLLNTIISEGIEAKNLSKYLEVMLDVVLDKLGFDGGGVYLVNREGTEASVVCSKNINNEFLNMIRTVNIAENPMYMKLFREGEIIFVDDYSVISPKKAEISGFNSTISIPVELDGDVIGALNLARTKSNDFEEFDMNLARSVADQIGSVIRRLQFEEELKEKIDELERWKKVTVGRELRMRELKEKIRTLESEK
jgi:PAS domain S-box-containing protein